MHNDSFFIKGARHLVCEDYARSCSEFGVVSDGCSSVAHADLGSRFIVLSALKHSGLLRKAGDDWATAVEEFYNTTITDAVKTAESIGVLYPSLHATLGVVVPTPTEYRTILCGDCFAVGRRRDGTLKIIEIDYSNMPYYPLYSVMDKEMIDESSMCATVKTVEVPQMGQPSITVTKADFQKYFLFDFPRDEFDLVAVTTDGIDKFVAMDEEDKPTTRIAYTEVARELFGKAKLDEKKRFFGVRALEDGLNRLVARYDNLSFADDLSFAVFLDE